MIGDTLGQFDTGRIGHGARADFGQGEGGVFGDCIAHFSVLEFQKRGLPHRHLLLWLDHDDVNVRADSAVDVAAAIDSIVCAGVARFA